MRRVRWPLAMVLTPRLASMTLDTGEAARQVARSGALIFFAVWLGENALLRCGALIKALAMPSNVRRRLQPIQIHAQQYGHQESASIA